MATWVINLRADPPAVKHVATAADIPHVADPINPVGAWQTFAATVASKPIVAIAHGYNVNAIQGFNALNDTVLAMDRQGRLSRLNLVPVILLWPGDALLGLNFPLAHRPAIDAGKRLARQLDRHVPASRISLISHSLGARVVLEAARALQKPRIDTLCLAAAAVDDMVFRPTGRRLPPGYEDIPSRCQQIMILHSLADLVLGGLYGIGDFTADALFGDSDSPFRPALGFSGPQPLHNPEPPPHRAIPVLQNFGHSDYLGQGQKAGKVADFFYHQLARTPSTWPPPAPKARKWPWQ